LKFALQGAGAVVKGATPAMQMLYNSDAFAVVVFESPAMQDGTPARGGYEIVDKFARKEIFIDGAMAEQFKAGVQALIDQSDQSGPDEEALDAFIGRYGALAQQPVILH
jgi:hypothetical protein